MSTGSSLQMERVNPAELRAVSGHMSRAVIGSLLSSGEQTRSIWGLVYPVSQF